MIEAKMKENEIWVSIKGNHSDVAIEFTLIINTLLDKGISKEEIIKLLDIASKHYEKCKANGTLEEKET